MGAARNYILVFAGCVGFHLIGTWSLPLIDRDEPRFAEASREMRERADFVVPYFNNQFRFDKPPLTYWCQIASYGVFGENDFAARFPTAIAAALVSTALMGWGKRMAAAKFSAAEHGGSYNAGAGDRHTGFWAAVIFTLCLQTFLHGKAAVADMWLVLFVTLAHWAGWELLRGSKAGFFWLLYPALALAFLAKGPIGWAPLLTFALTAGLFAREKRRLFFLPGIVLMLALVCAWGIPALARTHGEFFSVGIGKHVIGRSVGTMEGHGADSFGAYLALSPLYFVTIFASLFPWSIKLPALVRNMRLGHRDASDNYLLAGILVIFLIFTLVKTKLPHYTLPAFPLIALLMARRWQTLKLSPVMAGCTAIGFSLIALIAPPFLSRMTPSKMLAQQSRADLRPEMKFAAADYTEPSLVWYFRDSIHGFMRTLKPKDAVVYLAEDGPRFVIVPSSSVATLFPQIDPSWRTFRARGWNIAKAERVDVTMLLKQQ